MQAARKMPTEGSSVASPRPHTPERGFLRSIGTMLAISAATVITFVVAGEIYLRVTYADGLSFSHHAGPFVRTFEQDFQFNRFDGPSRGPQVIGPKAANSSRILIQGDSITWGQGVKEESALFSSLLRERLRAHSPDAEVAVLARPGREIDGHLEQLIRWGDEIDPDLIVYQWYINDIELAKDDRPRVDRGWRRYVFPGFARNHSYLWFLLDYRIGLLTGQRRPYEDYIRANFAENTQKWGLFADHFHQWAVEAKRRTPRLLIALYPRIRPQGVDFLEFHDRLHALAEREGIVVLDLLEPLGVFSEAWTDTFASSFDNHPGTETHQVIADALFDRIYALWPELLDPGLETGDEGRRTASRGAS